MNIVSNSLVTYVHMNSSPIICVAQRETSGILKRISYFQKAHRYLFYFQKSQFNDGEGEKGDVFVCLSNYFAITEEKHPACLGMKSTVGFGNWFLKIHLAHFEVPAGPCDSHGDRVIDKEESLSLKMSGRYWVNGQLRHTRDIHLQPKTKQPISHQFSANPHLIHCHCPGVFVIQKSFGASLCRSSFVSM